MLVIRLFRVGKKNQPSFKIVVTDKRRSTRAGRFIEEVGFYNPQTKEKVLKQERLKYWISVGAKPSATIQNLLISEKITEGKKIPVHKKAKKEPSVAKAMEGKGEKKAMSADLSAEASAKAEAPAKAKRTSSSSSPSLSRATAKGEEESLLSSPSLRESSVKKAPESKEEKPADEKPAPEKVAEEKPLEEAPKTETSNKEIPETSK